MKARKLIKNDNGKYDIIYFGSKGINYKRKEIITPILRENYININPYFKNVSNNNIIITCPYKEIWEEDPQDPIELLLEEGFETASIEGPNFIPEKAIVYFTEIYYDKESGIERGHRDFNEDFYLNSPSQISINPEQISGADYYYLNILLKENQIDFEIDTIHAFTGDTTLTVIEINRIEYFTIGSLSDLKVDLRFKYYNNGWKKVRYRYFFIDRGNNYLENIITLNDIINVYSKYSMVSNFSLTIITDQETSIDFTINYLEKIGDLLYNKNIRKEDDYYNKSIKFNYSEEQEGVRDSLIARLDIIKGELWYRSSYGLPLLDKIKSKGIYDSIIVDYIMQHPDVVNLEEFTSYIEEHQYKFDCIINTIYKEQVRINNE